VAEPVLLISSDPFLGASLEAIARGRVQVACLDLATRPAAWPAEPTATVVLDVAAGQRDAVHAWIRRHHRGPLVVLLKPGERRPALPPSPAQVVIGRPFRLADLVAILEHPPDPLSSGGLRLSPPDPPPPPGPDPDPAPPAQGPGGPAATDRDLLQASAAERRRRLDALSGHTAEPGPPGPGTGRPPRPDWPTAATVLDVRRPRPGARRRRVVARVLVGLLVLLALAAGWLALGLLEARQAPPVPASSAPPAAAGAADLRG
jgi:hypothetical protein